MPCWPVFIFELNIRSSLKILGLPNEMCNKLNRMPQIGLGTKYDNNKGSKKDVFVIVQSANVKSCN
jgi:hypothetical protein